MIERANAVLIAGPTASGKSRFAVEIAERLNGAIINTDSMQVYPVLRILTARPDDTDTARVGHHLYGHASLTEAYSVARWIEDVRTILDVVERAGKVPIFVGGTGLYFKALSEGLAAIPDIPVEIRACWRERAQTDKPGALYAELDKRDPSAARVLKANDLQRIVRALEVFDATGKSILSFQNRRQENAIIDIEKADKYLIQPERKELHRRIENRFDAMVEAGAIEEVKSLLSAEVSKNHPVLKAIGVPQFTSYLANGLSLDEACEKSKIATRQYAKRQLTWFRNQLNDNWKTIR